MVYESILRYPDRIVWQTEDGEFSKSGQEGSVKEGDVHIAVELGKESLEIFVTAETTPIKLIRFRWKLQKPLQGLVLGDAWERGYGDMAWQTLLPYRAMPWYFFVNKDRETAGYGVKVCPKALCFWQMDPKGITLWMDVRNGGSGVVLSGRTLKVAEVVCKGFDDMTAFEAGRAFCRQLVDYAIFPKKAVYGANNWYYAYGHSSEKEILADTDYLIQLTKDLENRPYMVIDDCWQRDRTDTYIGGPWVSNEKFPDMKTLADKIRTKGAIPGIWIRFLLDKSKEIPSEARLSHNGALDPSHPYVKEKITEEIRQICDWGYRLIKHDFTTFDIFNCWGFEMRPLMTKDGWHFYDRSKTTAEIVTDLYRTIYEATKSTETLVLGCNTIGHLGVGLMHMNRTGDDTSGKLWERSFRLGVNTLAFRMMQHGIFYDVDADCLGVTENIPWEYNKRFGKLLAISGTSLFVSVKPGALKPKEEVELAGFMALGSKQDKIAEPLDWQMTNMPQVWRRGEKTYKFDWYMQEGLRVPDYHTIYWEDMDADLYF